MSFKADSENLETVIKGFEDNDYVDWVLRPATQKLYEAYLKRRSLLPDEDRNVEGRVTDMRLELHEAPLKTTKKARSHHASFHR